MRLIDPYSVPDHFDCSLGVGFNFQHNGIAVLFAISQRQQDIEHSRGQGSKFSGIWVVSVMAAPSFSQNISVHDISIADILYLIYPIVKWQLWLEVDRYQIFFKLYISKER